MDRGRTPVRSILIVLLFVSGCYMTLEQRWAAFDAQMQQEIGVKTTEYYVAE